MNGNDQKNQESHEVIVRENVVHADDWLTGFQDAVEELTPLQVLIEASEWEDALERVRSHPQEILPVTREGGRNLTALHLACEDGESPLELIELLIAHEPDVVTMIDKDGNTPLHMACASEHAYNPGVIATLLAVYPQALMMQDDVECATPLHMFLLMGGEVNLTCLSMLLDVAYSNMAGLPKAYIPIIEYMTSPLETSLPIAAQFPPSLVRTLRQMAINDPYAFPFFLRPFLHLPTPEADEVVPRTFKNQGMILKMTNSKKQTPLHAATARGLSLAVVRKLLNERRYPGAHMAAQMKDQKTRTPLFYTGVYGMPIDAIKPIFDLNKDAAVHFEEYRIIPLHSCYTGVAHSNDDRKMEITSMRSDATVPIEEYFVLSGASVLYHKMDLFLRMTYHKSCDDPPGPGLRYRTCHAAAGCRTPMPMVKAAIKLNPWQLQEGDEEGNLPLHIACKQVYPEGNDPDHYWLAAGVPRDKIHIRLVAENGTEDYPIHLFLDAFPGGASVLNCNSQSPLHLAILSNKRWEEGIRKIVSAAPMALTARDKKYRLYPFMLAAMEEVNSLDVVFNLLLSNPTIVQVGVNGSTHPSRSRPPKKQKQRLS